jgi:hypothetical protein
MRTHRDLLQRPHPPYLPHSRTVIFGTAGRGCLLPQRCTTSKTGPTPNLHPHDARLRQARRDWRDSDELGAVYPSIALRLKIQLRDDETEGERGIAKMRSSNEP